MISDLLACSPADIIGGIVVLTLPLLAWAVLA